MALESELELPDADFYAFEALLSDREQEKLAELREFLKTEVAPHAGQWWQDAYFPAELLDRKSVV